MYEIDSAYDRRLKRRRRIDPTRELNYTPEHWERHKNVYRRERHIFTTFGSSPFQRLLFPDFIITSFVAAGLTYYNSFIAIDVAQQLCLDGSSAAAATTAIALLTGFRLNASYGRYNEARKLMGLTNSATRNLASNSIVWMSSQESKDRMLNLVKAFPVAMNFHLNVKGSHHNIRRKSSVFKEQIFAEYYAEMLDIYQDKDDDDFVKLCQWFRSNENIPLGIAFLMREIIRNNCMVDASGFYNRELEISVQKLITSLGGSERIQKTPIPTCVTRHTSRLLFVWSNMLPFAIYPVCGLYTLPCTIALSYSMVAIEDIGVQLEEPFNILPLRQYSDGIYDGVQFLASIENDTNGDGNK